MKTRILLFLCLFSAFAAIDVKAESRGSIAHCAVKDEMPDTVAVTQKQYNLNYAHHSFCVALPVAAVMFDKIKLENKNIVCLVSGGNIDVNILSRVINKALIKTGRISYLTIELLDKPGQLRDVSTIIANHGANVIRVRHNQGGKGTDINECYLNIVIETRNFEHFTTIINALKDAGYTNITTKE